MIHAAHVASLERLIDTYCEGWNEPDPVRREQILKRVWATRATYTDPRTHAAGIAGLCAHIGKVRAGRPGARVIRTSAIDAHHGLLRFMWRVVQADGTMLPEGIDFAEISRGGKILRVIGFFGPLTASDRVPVQASVAPDTRQAACR